MCNYLCNQCISPITLWVRILLRRCVLDTILCDKVCQWLVAGWCISPSTPDSSTNKTDRHDIAEILSKVALNTIILSLFLDLGSCISLIDHLGKGHVIFVITKFTIYYRYGIAEPDWSYTLGLLNLTVHTLWVFWTSEPEGLYTLGLLNLSAYTLWV